VSTADRGTNRTYLALLIRRGRWRLAGSRFVLGGLGGLSLGELFLLFALFRSLTLLLQERIIWFRHIFPGGVLNGSARRQCQQTAETTGGPSLTARSVGGRGQGRVASQADHSPELRDAEARSTGPLKGQSDWADGLGMRERASHAGTGFCNATA